LDRVPAATGIQAGLARRSGGGSQSAQHQPDVSVLGHVSRDNRQTQVRFASIECGFEENADLVGAINILAAGHAVLACGGTAQSGHPAKQESAEAIMQEFALV